MRDKAVVLVKEAVSELNEELDYDSLRDVNDQTPLFGGESGIDSLSLVMLVTTLESAIFDELGCTVSLADEKAMSMRNSPYRSVGALAEFIAEKLGEV